MSQDRCGATVNKASYFRDLSKEYFESSQGRAEISGVVALTGLKALSDLFFSPVMVLIFVFFAFFSIIILTNVLSEFLKDTLASPLI